MSVRIMSLVWDNFPVGGSEKLAMLAMADWGNDKGESIYPSIATISKKINLSESQARRVVHWLIENDYLFVVGNHFGGNKHQSRHYKINLEKLATPSVDATPSPSVDATPSMDATPSTHARPPLAPTLPVPLAYMRATPSVDATQTIKEPLIEPLIEPLLEKTEKNKPPDKKKTQSKEISLLSDFGITGQVAEDFVVLRKAKKAAITKTALNLLANEASKAGITNEQAVLICINRSWQGFNASWNWQDTLQETSKQSNGARASPQETGVRRFSKTTESNIATLTAWIEDGKD